MIPTVLSIAGSDPSGGAGCQADIKTCTDLSTYGMAVVTVITVQSPTRVERVAALPADLVIDQLKIVLEDMPVHAIKVGLIGSTAIAEGILDALDGVEVPLVVDPIRQSTTGTTMGTIRPAVFAKVLERAQVVTPNTPELTAIIGELPPGRWAIENGTAILHTGGHGSGDRIEDVLWMADGTHRRWTNPRVATEHTHGSGCTLSTALACHLARGASLPEAAEAAVLYTGQLIQRSARTPLVESNGPLLHGTGRETT